MKIINQEEFDSYFDKDFSDPDEVRIVAREKIFTDCIFLRCDCNDRFIESCEFTNCKFRKCNFSKCVFYASKFLSCNIKKCLFEDCHFSRTIIHKTKFIRKSNIITKTTFI